MSSTVKHVGLSFALALSVVACSDDGGDELGDETETSSGDGDGDAAGDGDGDGDTGAPLSHAADIQPIWDAKCTNAGCHQPGGSFEALDLSGDAYDNIVGVTAIQAPELQRIEAGNSAGSYLINKLLGTQEDVGGSGSGMPPTPLEPDDILIIAQWANEGALP